MRRIDILTKFQGKSVRRSAEPRQSNPEATSLSVEAWTSEGRPFEVELASYSNQVTHTGESTFVETGMIRFDDAGDQVEIVTVGEGTLAPSADADLAQGAVIYRITDGRGQFAGASGLITSNFLLRRGTGEFDERQIAIVFLP